MTDSRISYEALKNSTHELEGTTLSEVVNDTEKSSVRLHFKHWDGKSITACCSGVVLCNVSVLDINDQNTEVIGARLEIFENGAVEQLKNAGYLWHAGQSRLNFSYPLFQLSLDGDICVVIFCGQIDFN